MLSMQCAFLLRMRPISLAFSHCFPSFCRKKYYFYKPEFYSKEGKKCETIFGNF